MADNHTTEVRSYNMSRIRSKGSKPEETVRKFLFSKGLRYRKNDNRFPGRPDIVMPKFKTIIFVNGCFWHMNEGCPDFTWPKSNPEYWEPKLRRNRRHDIDNIAALEGEGWRVITVWECELKGKQRAFRLQNLYHEITGA